jgi:hypothetical protein
MTPVPRKRDDHNTRIAEELREQLSCVNNDDTRAGAAFRTGAKPKRPVRRPEDRVCSKDVHAATLCRRNEITYPVRYFCEPPTCDDVNFSGYVVPLRLLWVVVEDDAGVEAEPFVVTRGEARVEDGADVHVLVLGCA